MDDYDRTLNGRGREAAQKVSKWLIEKGYLPDTVLVSAARRTVETWERMAPFMPETATMESNPALYLATADIILATLKTQSTPSVMVICHNPGIAEFAENILISPPEHPKFGQYPSGATTVIAFDAASWDQVNWRGGTVLDFTVPRDL